MLNVQLSSEYDSNYNQVVIRNLNLNHNTQWSVFLVYGRGEWNHDFFIYVSLKEHDENW